MAYIELGRSSASRLKDKTNETSFLQLSFDSAPCFLPLEETSLCSVGKGSQPVKLAEHSTASKYLYYVRVPFLNPDTPGVATGTLSAGVASLTRPSIGSPDPAGVTATRACLARWMRVMSGCFCLSLPPLFFFSHSYGYHVSPRLPPPTKKTHTCMETDC